DGSVHLQRLQRAPRIVSMAAHPAANTPVSRILLFVDQPVAEASLSVADISIEGPEGSVAIESVSLAADGTIAVDLIEARTAEADYQLRLQPNWTSADGVRPDQDGDDLSGEPEDDAYIG